ERSADREGEVPRLQVVVAFADRWLERAHRVVSDVADGAAPETRKPLEPSRRWAPLSERRAQRVPRIGDLLPGRRPVPLDLEGAAPPTHDHRRLAPHEAEAPPLLAALD